MNEPTRHHLYRQSNPGEMEHFRFEPKGAYTTVGEFDPKDERRIIRDINHPTPQARIIFKQLLNDGYCRSREQAERAYIARNSIKNVASRMRVK